jgi:hypothetical protein
LLTAVARPLTSSYAVGKRPAILFDNNTIDSPAVKRGNCSKDFLQGKGRVIRSVFRRFLGWEAEQCLLL